MGREVQGDEGDGRILLGYDKATETVKLRPNRFQVFLGGGEFGFKLDSFVYEKIVDHMHTHFRLHPELPACSYCITKLASLYVLF